MPNGSPRFLEEELPALVSFFSTVADLLTEFASTYNLSLDKYWHQFHSWRFNFQHPKGGLASVEVMKEDDSVRIYSYWWLDSYDEFTRSIKKDESEMLEKSEVTLDLLEGKFRSVLSWELGEWTQIAKGYEDFWKPLGREYLEKDMERYPRPRV
jgi:hypothetical protein